MHVGKHQLEAVAQSLHIRIRVLLQLIALRNDLDRPVLQARVLACLETQVKVAGVFAIDAERICRAARVGFGIRLEPLIWRERGLAHNRRNEQKTRGAKN